MFDLAELALADDGAPLEVRGWRVAAASFGRWSTDDAPRRSRSRPSRRSRATRRNSVSP